MTSETSVRTTSRARVLVLAGAGLAVFYVLWGLFKVLS